MGVGILGLTIGAAAVAAVMLAGPASDVAGQLSGPSAAESESPSAYAGEVTAATAVSATADCLAPPATDDAGNPVRYDPQLVLDGDPQTAWRCSGPGAGERVVFTFEPGTEIAEVGLVNGYAKVDPQTKVRRYGQYRRVIEVLWTVGDLTVRQRLDDEQQQAQTLRIPTQRVSEVTLTIRKTTEPGLSTRSRDAVLISEVTFGTPE